MAGALRPPRRGEVPPVELHEVEALAPEARKGAVDHPGDRAPIDSGQRSEVRHVLGVDPDPGGRRPAPRGGEPGEEGPDHLLDPGVDVGAVEGDDAGVDEGGHVRHRPLGLHRAVVARELPATLDEARDAVTRPEHDRLHRAAFPGRGRHEAPPSSRARGTAEVSAWRKERSPMRVMRNLAPQWGSGQATSSSVVIQSFGSAGALLRGEERKEGRERVQGEAPPAVLRKHELLPDHEEVLPLPVIAHHRPPGGDHLDPEVVEGEALARPVVPAAHLPSFRAPGSGVRGRLRQMTPSARRRSMRAAS